MYDADSRLVRWNRRHEEVTGYSTEEIAGKHNLGFFPEGYREGIRQAVQKVLFRPELRCLFMSGYTADVIAHQGVLDVGLFFIQKPFSLQSFAARVRNALDQAQG